MISVSPDRNPSCLLNSSLIPLMFRFLLVGRVTLIFAFIPFSPKRNYSLRSFKTVWRT